MLQLGIGASMSTFASNVLPSASSSPCVTPAQTEGPFYPEDTQVEKDLDLTTIKGNTTRAEGDIIYVDGLILDEYYRPIPDSLVDIWQANTHGRYLHEDDPNPAPLDKNFQGWGQIKTDDQGRYRFKTIMPGAYPVNKDWSRPPHIHFKVSKRGYHELTTQMYFAGHPLNNKDKILLALPEGERGKVIVNFHTNGGHHEPDAKSGQFIVILRRVETH